MKYICSICDKECNYRISVIGFSHKECDDKLWEYTKKRLSPKWGEWGCLQNHDPIKELDEFKIWKS